MNGAGSRALVGSPHVDSLMFRWLSPVRASGAVVHLLERSAAGRAENAFCGEAAPYTERGTRRWRRVKVAGGKVCNACSAAACALVTKDGKPVPPSRIDWSC